MLYFVLLILIYKKDIKVNKKNWNLKATWYVPGMGQYEILMVW